MRKVIRDGQVVEDNWQYIEDGVDVPADGDVLVSLARWQEDADALSARTGQTGVFTNGAVDFDALVAVSSIVDAIALTFDKFADGRSYSHAHLLRTRHGYKKDLRATGDVLRDQVFYYNRVGFNVLEIRADKDIEAAVESLKDFSVLYQPAADGADPIYSKERPDA